MILDPTPGRGRPEGRGHFQNDHAVERCSLRT
jgi:hypothetical protein